MRALDVDVGVVGDQPGGAAELFHDVVAGVDAQPALDAAEIGAAADIDAGRADMHALQAIDAVAGRLAVRAQLLGLLDRAARLAAVVAIGDVERVFVGQRRLDARPRAHIEADLLAHMAGERIGGEGEDADPGIGDERRLPGGELLHQRRRVGEIENPGAAGPPRHHQPEEMLDALARPGFGGPFAGVALHVLAAVAFDEALDGEEQIGPHRLRAEIAAPDAAGDARSSGTAPIAARINRPVR